MSLIRKKGYKFTDEMMARDAIISLILGGISLLFIVFSIVFSVIKKGNVPDFFGAFLLASFVLAATAFIFGLLSYKDQDGGLLSKRASVIISIIDIALCAVIYII